MPARHKHVVDLVLRQYRIYSQIRVSSKSCQCDLGHVVRPSSTIEINHLLKLVVCLPCVFIHSVTVTVCDSNMSASAYNTQCVREREAFYMLCPASSLIDVPGYVNPDKLMNVPIGIS